MVATKDNQITASKPKLSSSNKQFPAIYSDCVSCRGKEQRIVGMTVHHTLVYLVGKIL